MPTQSPWFRSEQKRAPFPGLAEDLQVDVAVIGGGITGITTAYYLAKAGKKVVLLEQGTIGNGDTGNTTAFITYVTDPSLSKLEKKFGREHAARVWQSGADTIHEIEQIVNEEGIDCGFIRCPAVIFAANEAGHKRLRDEYARIRWHDFPAIFRSDSLPFTHHDWIEIPRQAKFHPIRYLYGLADAAVKAGARVYENTHVHDVEGEGPITLTTSGGRVMAEDVVVATHDPVTQPYQFPMRTEGKRTYVLEATLAKGMLEEGIYWDNDNPYHYFRVDWTDEGDRLIIGGEDHVTGQSDIPEEHHFILLREYLERLFPISPPWVMNQWSGQVYETVDGLPYIGRAMGHPHYYVGTGYAGNGMTFGTMAGEIIRGLIIDGDHKWADLYRSARIQGAGTMIGMGASVMRAWIGGRKGDVESTEAIEPGKGAVIIENGKPVAVFKSKEGKILKLSAVCTHLKCTVKWNTAEDSWDCPCHGSRFSKEGDVLNGPAMTPLERIDPV